MEYRLRLGETVIPLAVERGDEGRMQLTRDGQVRDVRYRMISAHHFHLEIDGQGVNAYVAADGPGRTVIVRGVPYYLEDADLQPTVKKGSRAAAPTMVTPPMPAVVVAVLTAVGQTVRRGDPLIIVTAMKMETTLTAPYDGLVTAVNAAAGDKVMPGQVLADIQKDDQLEDI
ncbi:MAG: biotin/lipoyl-containing protein [Pseudomonadota bacterium]